MKQRIHQLLAIATFVGASSTAIAAPRTLANGAPAPGNTVAKGKPRYDQHAEAVRAKERAEKSLSVALVEVREAKQALVANPRTLPNGAPACGNTASKAAPTCTADIANEEYQKRVARVRESEVVATRARIRLHEATRKVQETPKGTYAFVRGLDDDDVW